MSQAEHSGEYLHGNHSDSSFGSLRRAVSNFSLSAGLARLRIGINIGTTALSDPDRSSAGPQLRSLDSERLASSSAAVSASMPRLRGNAGDEQPSSPRADALPHAPQEDRGGSTAHGYQSIEPVRYIPSCYSVQCFSECSASQSSCSVVSSS